jgi:hypothetical protein
MVILNIAGTSVVYIVRLDQNAVAHYIYYPGFYACWFLVVSVQT